MDMVVCTWQFLPLPLARPQVPHPIDARLVSPHLRRASPRQLDRYARTGAPVVHPLVLVDSIAPSLPSSVRSLCPSHLRFMRAPSQMPPFFVRHVVRRSLVG
eukprot:scaffold723_cov333-Pavlova_lutheri.AAC.5